MFFVSCSSIQFSSANRLSVDMNYSEENSTEISIEVARPFYLWGMYPPVQVINVDEEFEDKGFSNVSDLRIIETDIAQKALWMFFTFGMYYPQTYDLVASTK